MLTADVFGDDRFKIIKKYHDEIVRKTNIVDSDDEMDVIDNILFRMLKIGWLDMLEMQMPKNIRYEFVGDKLLNPHYGYIEAYCPTCDCLFQDNINLECDYCPHCGQRLDWGDKK